MRIAPPGVLPDAPAEPEDLIREARRRQHRRWIAAGATGVVLLAGVAGVVADLAGHRHGRASSFGHTKTKTVPRPEVTTPTPIPRSIGTTLLMWPVGYPGFGPSGGPPAYVDDLSKGRLASSQKPAISAGDFQPLLAHVGRWFVYVGNGATAIRDDLTGHPRVLGPTSFFAPAAEPGRVWLFQLRNGQKRPARARTVALSGGPPSQPVTLPANAYLPAIRGTDAGLLLQVPQGLALWNPGSAPRTLPYSPNIAYGFDATSRLVAYGTGCSSQATAQNAPCEPNAGYYMCPGKRLWAYQVATGRTGASSTPCCQYTVMAAAPSRSR